MKNNAEKLNDFMEDNLAIDEIDRRIIVATQQGLPLCPQPYHVVAEQIGVSVEEVMQRMQRMLNNGIIRRIGAVPNHYKLGYKANGMTVWDVPDNKIQEMGEKIGALDFVSHCYQRPRHQPLWNYNLFAMVHGQNREQVLMQTQMIAEILGDNDLGHEILFSTRILKKTGMRIGTGRQD
jgi:DNA-binding Lrp family transcriptional regulator